MLARRQAAGACNSEATRPQASRPHRCTTECTTTHLEPPLLLEHATRVLAHPPAPTQPRPTLISGLALGLSSLPCMHVKRKAKAPNPSPASGPHVQAPQARASNAPTPPVPTHPCPSTPPDAPSPPLFSNVSKWHSLSWWHCCLVLVSGGVGDGRRVLVRQPQFGLQVAPALRLLVKDVRHGLDEHAAAAQLRRTAQHGAAQHRAAQHSTGRGGTGRGGAGRDE